MPSADQVPTNNSHSRMRWHKWVVLIAGSTGSALRAVRPPNRHITPAVRRDLVTPQARRGACNARPWPSWPPSAQSCWQVRWRRPWSASPQQRREPGPMFGAVNPGIADDGERTGHEQAAQIASPCLLMLPRLSLPPLECCFLGRSLDRQIARLLSFENFPGVDTGGRHKRFKLLGGIRDRKSVV